MDNIEDFLLKIGWKKIDDGEETLKFTAKGSKIVYKIPKTMLGKYDHHNDDYSPPYSIKIGGKEEAKEVPLDKGKWKFKLVTLKFTIFIRLSINSINLKS